MKLIKVNVKWKTSTKELKSPRVSQVIRTPEHREAGSVCWTNHYRQRSLNISMDISSPGEINKSLTC